MLNCRTNKYSWIACQVFFSLALMTGLIGCGPSLSNVDGTVTYKGEKVKGGMLIFSPTAGEPAAATVKEDGTFTLKTGTSAGAIAGKSSVSYSPPSGEASTDPKKEGKPSPYAGLVVKTPSVEIKSGKNTFSIELERGK
jgi:hypothetical protein